MNDWNAEILNYTQNYNHLNCQYCCTHHSVSEKRVGQNLSTEGSRQQLQRPGDWLNWVTEWALSVYSVIVGIEHTHTLRLKAHTTLGSQCVQLIAAAPSSRESYKAGSNGHIILSENAWHSEVNHWRNLYWDVYETVGKWDTIIDNCTATQPLFGYDTVCYYHNWRQSVGNSYWTFTIYFTNLTATTLQLLQPIEAKTFNWRPGVGNSYYKFTIYLQQLLYYYYNLRPFFKSR